VEVSPAGIVGDRAYALIDTETGKVVSAKNPKLWPGMLQCQAAFVEPPRAGDDLPPARVTFPDGTSTTTDAPDADARLADFLGRKVTLARSAPEDFTIDQYHPDIEDLDPEGRRDTVVEQKLGASFFEEAGMPSAVPPGSFFDLFPLTVITTSTLARLAELTPGTQWDPRRFRMNVVVASDELGFVENDWPGRQLQVGDVPVFAAIPDPRCVMTTLAQPGLGKDADVLRTLVRHNRLDVAGAGLFACAGVYAVPVGTGTLHVGDAVTLD
jgi:uncharacterized protein YcbX